MKNKKGFNVSFEKSGRFNILKINFCAKKHQDSHYIWIGNIEFQQNAGEDEFYGGRVNVEGGKFFEIEMMYKIIKDIKENVSLWSSDFDALLEYIKNNYHRCIFDAREQQIIRVKDMREKELKRYMLQNRKGCIADILAKTEEEALEGMVKEVKAGLEKNIYREKIKKFLQEWLKKPHVNLDNSSLNNELKSIDEIIYPERSRS